MVIVTFTKLFIDGMLDTLLIVIVFICKLLSDLRVMVVWNVKITGHCREFCTCYK